VRSWLVPDLNRPHDVKGLTDGELARARRDLYASVALARPDSPERGPIMAHLSAIETELAERAKARPDQARRHREPHARPASPDRSAHRPVVVLVGQAAVTVDRRRGLTGERWLAVQADRAATQTAAAATALTARMLIRRTTARPGCVGIVRY
jgi:hypothetical protein